MPKPREAKPSDTSRKAIATTRADKSAEREKLGVKLNIITDLKKPGTVIRHRRSVFEPPRKRKLTVLSEMHKRSLHLNWVSRAIGTLSTGRLAAAR